MSMWSFCIRMEKSMNCMQDAPQQSRRSIWCGAWCAVLLLIGVQTSAIAGKSATQWVANDMSKAFRLAGNKKPVVVLTQADWCTPCKQLSYEVIESDEGRKLLQGAVGVKVNFETPEGRKATKRFRVLGLPTTLVLSAKGEEIGRVVGYPGKAAYTQALKDLLAGKSDLKALRAQLKQRPKDRKLLVSFAQKMLVRGKIAAAKKILLQQMKTKDGTGAWAARMWGRYLLRVQRNGVEGTKHFVWAMIHFKKTPYFTGFMYWAAKGYQMQGKTAKALALFDDLAKKQPGRVGPTMMKAGFMIHYKLMPAKSEALIRQVLKKRPKMAWLQYLLAQARAQQGDKKGAKAAIARAIAMRPKLAIFKFYRSQLK